MTLGLPPADENEEAMDEPVFALPTGPVAICKLAQYMVWSSHGSALLFFLFQTTSSFYPLVRSWAGLVSREPKLATVPASVDN